MTTAARFLGGPQDGKTAVLVGMPPPPRFVFGGTLVRPAHVYVPVVMFELADGWRCVYEHRPGATIPLPFPYHPTGVPPC